MEIKQNMNLLNKNTNIEQKHEHWTKTWILNKNMNKNKNINNKKTWLLNKNMNINIEQEDQHEQEDE